MRATSCCGVTPSLSALSMMGAPCASSAPTKNSSCPCILWKRTQMSAWMYSMMWPMWNGPFAYGSAVVTKILRAIRPSLHSLTRVRGARRRFLSRVLELLEARLVDGLLVGLGAADLPLLEQLLDRRVHGAHAELTAGLHGVLELIKLALANEVRGRGRVDEDLQSRDPALLVRALQELLRDDATQGRGEHGAHVRLLVGREHVHHAVHRGRGAVGVQRAHDQNAHLRGGDGDAHGLKIAQLSDQDHVRVFAQRRVDSRGEAPAVNTDLALADKAALAFVHEL